MEVNEYQKECLRTVVKIKKDDVATPLLEGVMGLNGEAGECMELMKKNIFQGHPLSSEHMARELGDVAWYLAVSASAIGYDLETIFKMNVEKRRERYPERFDSERSQHRKAGDI